MVELYDCSRFLCGLLTSPVCSMSVGRVVDASAVVVPYHPVLQVGQWHAVGEVSAAGPLCMRSPTICMPMGCERFILLVIAVVVVIIEEQVSEGKGIGSIQCCIPPY